MGKSDLESASDKWVERIKLARSAGLPDSTWTGLMKNDLHAIMQRGSSPMDDKPVYDAMLATHGLSPIKDPGKGHGFLDVIGNIPSDIQGIVSGFPAGVAEYVTTLPEQFANLKNIKFTTDIHEPGEAFRNVAQTPVVGPLLPGVATAAAASTPEGRKQLEEHPVSALIDVGATVSLAGKAGLFGRSAKAGLAAENEAAGLSRIEASKAAAVEAPKTSLEALRQGQPYKATGRAVMAGYDALPGVSGRLTSESIFQGLKNGGISTEWARVLSQPRAHIQQRGLMEMKDFAVNTVVKPIRALADDDQGLLTRIVTETADDADRAAFANRPDLQTLESGVRELNAKLNAADPHLVPVTTPWGKDVHFAEGTPTANAFNKYSELTTKLDDLETQLNDRLDQARRMQDRWGPMHRFTRAAIKKAKATEVAYRELTGEARKAEAAFNTVLADNAPAAFYPSRTNVALESAVAHAKSTTPEGFGFRYDPSTGGITHASGKWASAAEQSRVRNYLANELPSVISHIRSSVDQADLAAAIGSPELAETLMRDAERTWVDASKGGADPVFLPNVLPSQVERSTQPTVAATGRYYKPESARNTTFNLSRSVHDVSVGLLERKKQQLIDSGTREFVDNHLRPLAKTSTTIHNDIRNAIANGGFSDVHVQNHIVEETKRNYVKWNPERFGLQEYFPSPEGGDIMIPRGVERSLKFLGYGKDTNPLMAIYDKGMKVWRFSVLTTPRHISHVVLGGMMMGLLQDPRFLLDMRSAWKMMRAEDPEIFAKMGRGINNVTPDQLYELQSKASMGRILTEINKGVHWVNRWEDNATLMYKAAMMLRKERHILARETPEMAMRSTTRAAARDEAMRIANKVFVDVNAMTPFERATFTKVMPFYGFTRHLFRYMMTYPADHPLAAAMLTNFANQHQRDWQSGLPQAMQFMFFLGPPDADGNVAAVDYRSIDPFRSFYNDFSIAGLTAQANPAIQFLAQQAGINVLTATPELYPGSHYDPSSGTMVADRPSNIGINLLETMVPSTQGLDALFQISDQYRNLKISDPEAYKHRVYTAFGIPFGPETVNVPEKIELAQMKRYSDAQTSINRAIQTGDFAKAKRYGQVPVPSLMRPYLPNMQYATPGQIETIYNAIKDVLPEGISPHAILPKYSR